VSVAGACVSMATVARTAGPPSSFLAGHDGLLTGWGHRVGVEMEAVEVEDVLPAACYGTRRGSVLTASALNARGVKKPKNMKEPKIVTGRVRMHERAPRGVCA
jgi:hypothetical protein